VVVMEGDDGRQWDGRWDGRWCLRSFRSEAGARESPLVEELVEGEDSWAGHAENLARLNGLFK